MRKKAYENGSKRMSYCQYGVNGFSQVMLRYFPLLFWTPVKGNELMVFASEETENQGVRHRSKRYYMQMAESKTVKFKVPLPKVRSVASSRRIKDAVRTVKGSASGRKKK
jgi:hypothetical protein